MEFVFIVLDSPRREIFSSIMQPPERREMPAFAVQFLDINFRSVRTMKFLLAICMMFAASIVCASGDNAPRSSAGNSVEGKVLEVKYVDNFTYLRLQTRTGESWAAVIDAQVKEGDTVKIENAMLMENFESKGLKRTFNKIIFGNIAGAGKSTAGYSVLGASFSVKPPAKLEKIKDVAIPKASGANAATVEEVITKSAQLKGKTVVVRGKVVKYNAGIMGKNWIHLYDGSGSAANESDDILVTTSGTSNVGEIVTVKGVVNVDQDFGAGYAYKVLIEDATVQK